MTYQETLDWLFRQLPMFQRQGAAAFRKDLDKIQALAKALNHPEKKFKSIHIAGTNGKGSVAHFLAAGFQANGYKTGLYTSPHLLDFRERIKINGEMIPKAEVVDFVERNKNIIDEIKPSFFEMTVAMAFQHFASEEVDMAIIETGMGGRLDATNIIRPEVSVITNIGLDHQQFLGETLEEIAGEKAGIMKEKTPLVLGMSPGGYATVFEENAKSLKAPIHWASAYPKSLPQSDLLGQYQSDNLKTALTTIDLMRERGYDFEEEKLRESMGKVRVLTGFRGRWEVVGKSPDIVLDTCHNVDGIKEALKSIVAGNYSKVHWIYGAVADKDLGAILETLPKSYTYYLAKPDIPRGKEVDRLAEEFAAYDLNHQRFETVGKAMDAAKKEAEKGDLILVGGSIFLLQDVLSDFPLA